MYISGIYNYKELIYHVNFSILTKNAIVDSNKEEKKNGNLLIETLFAVVFFDPIQVTLIIPVFDGFTFVVKLFTFR